MWFQQDGATCHIADATLDVLRQKFPGYIISKFNDVNWPPTSCHLTPLDFSLWDYVKSRNVRAPVKQHPPSYCQDNSRNEQQNNGKLPQKD